MVFRIISRVIRRRLQPFPANEYLSGKLECLGLTVVSNVRLVQDGAYRIYRTVFIRYTLQFLSRITSTAIKILSCSQSLFSSFARHFSSSSSRKKSFARFSIILTTTRPVQMNSISSPISCQFSAIFYDLSAKMKRGSGSRESVRMFRVFPRAMLGRPCVLFVSMRAGRFSTTLPRAICKTACYVHSVRGDA